MLAVGLGAVVVWGCILALHLVYMPGALFLYWTRQTMVQYYCLFKRTKRGLIGMVMRSGSGSQWRPHWLTVHHQCHLVRLCSDNDC